MNITKNHFSIRHFWYEKFKTCTGALSSSLTCKISDDSVWRQVSVEMLSACYIHSCTKGLSDFSHHQIHRYPIYSSLSLFLSCIHSYFVPTHTYFEIPWLVWSNKVFSSCSLCYTYVYPFCFLLLILNWSTTDYQSIRLFYAVTVFDHFTLAVTKIIINKFTYYLLLLAL